jgi:predicted phage gp36 major capsid-like protein
MDTGLETKVAFSDFMQAFEAFKDANDERLEQIERRMGEDVVTAEKVERINRAVDQTKARLDELALKALRPRLATGAGEPQPASEHKQALHRHGRLHWRAVARKGCRCCIFQRREVAEIA